MPEPTIPTPEPSEPTPKPHLELEGVATKSFFEDRRFGEFVSGREFKKNPVNYGELKSFLRQDIAEDYNTLPVLIREYVSRKPFFISKEENDIFNKFITTWWQEKYGFEYQDATQRERLLRLKYAPDKKSQFDILKNRLVERHPQELEGITAFFELIDYLEGQKKSNKSEFTSLNTATKFTQAQFLCTHFVDSHADDPAYLREFWKNVEIAAGNRGLAQELKFARSGIYAQVTMLRTLRELGFDATLASPDEDARYAIDMWADENTAVQVKSWGQDFALMFSIGTNMLYPAEQFDELDADIQATILEEYYRFKNKLEQFEQDHAPRAVDGHFVMLPRRRIEPVAGTPAKYILDFFAEKIV